MSSVGVKIDQFDVPVCNSFQAKILNDQLCYEVDLSKVSNKNKHFEPVLVCCGFFLDTQSVMYLLGSKVAVR